MSKKSSGSVEDSSQPLPTLAQVRSEAEAEAIREALTNSGGNRRVAAQLLGISEATLYRKLSALRARGRHPDDP